MRIKMLRSPAQGEVDGVDLRRFVAGHTYEVGSQIGALLLAEAWAEPLPDHDPAAVIPVSESDPFMPRLVSRTSPPNLTRETYPSYGDDVAIAADLARRKRRRQRDD